MHGYSGIQNSLHQEYKARGFSPETTIVTPDNIGLLVSRDNLRRMANIASQNLKRPLSGDEIGLLFNFMQGLTAADYRGLSLADAEQAIVRDFLTRKDAMRRARGLMDGDQPDIGTPGSNYFVEELRQLTPDENQIKFASFADRVGVALVDRDRAGGKRGTPNNFSGNRGPTPEQTNKALYEMAGLITSFLDPKSVDSMLQRIQSIQTTFHNINLPHQIIPLDSRGRKVTGNNSEYSWNINMSARPGSRGDLWVQDTVQQDIQMRVYPFWMPNHRLTNPYQKVRLLVHEFRDQAVRASEFVGVPEHTEVNPYHFELDVAATVGNRSLLQPSQKYFSFRRVLAQVNTITISFRTPYEPLELEPDSGVFAVATGSPTIFTGTVPHNLDTGDLIYVQNFASTNAALNASINRESGWYATVLNAVSFSIIADTSAVGNQSGVSVYYGSKRITINLEFTQIEQ